MKYILMDVEGTTTSITFVHDVLFPYAKERIESFINAHLDNDLIQNILADTKKTVLEENQKAISNEEAITHLIEWIKIDRKHPALKKIQGMIWKIGYQSGELKGHVYPDVPTALETWKNLGIGLGIYSSGSVEAQKDLFSHSTHGNLDHYFSNNFDTGIGAKREVKSYQNISDELRIEPSEILFLSDIAEELDAAKLAGFQTTQLVRQHEHVPFKNHPQALNFLEVKF